jgi:hypothetical protein
MDNNHEWKGYWGIYAQWWKTTVMQRNTQRPLLGNGLINSVFLRQQRIQKWATVFYMRSVPTCCTHDRSVSRESLLETVQGRSVSWVLLWLRYGDSLGIQRKRNVLRWNTLPDYWLRPWQHTSVCVYVWPVCVCERERKREWSINFSHELCVEMFNKCDYWSKLRLWSMHTGENMKNSWPTWRNHLGICLQN